MTDRQPDRRGRAHGVLTHIAGTLGCTVESLQGATRSGSIPEETGELVRSWHTLERVEDRDAILAHARRLAGMSGQPDELP